MNSIIIILGGPTGVGKTVIAKKIIKRMPNIKRPITTTTRSPRKHEKNGISYYFIDKRKFIEKKDKKDFFETSYYPSRDTYYGTEKKEINSLLSRNHIIMALDTVGLKAYKKKYHDRVLSIFISPDNFENIKKHLLKRQPKLTNENLTIRLKNADDEIKRADHLYDYVVINKEGKLKDTVNKVIKIIDDKLQKISRTDTY